MVSNFILYFIHTNQIVCTDLIFGAFSENRGSIPMFREFEMNETRSALSAIYNHKLEFALYLSLEHGFIMIFERQVAAFLLSICRTVQVSAPLHR